jgi:hypothetical protein
MARIQQYKTDTTITGGDKLVGNDAADNSTKLFQISDIGLHFAKQGDGINYQYTYGGKYTDTSVDAGSIEYLVDPTAPQQFGWANIQKLALSNTLQNGTNVSGVYSLFTNQIIKVTDISGDGQNSYAIYKVTNIEDTTGGKLISVTLLTSDGTPTEANVIVAFSGIVRAEDIDALVSTDIIDDLLSTDATKVLSANQGRVLKGLIDGINTILQSDDTSLDTLQEVVDYIKANNASIASLNTSVSNLSTTKVDKIVGKGLSTEDFTSALLAKLNSIAANAEVNVQSNWAEADTNSDAFIQNKPSVVETPRTIEIAGTTNEVNVTPTGAQDLSADRTFTVGLTDDVEIADTLSFTNTQSSTPTFDNGLYFTTENNHDTLHFRYHGHDLSIDYLTENIPTGILNGGELSTNTATTFDVAAGDGVINILNKTASDPHPEIKKVEWSATTITHTLGNASETDQLNTWIYVDSTGAIQQTLTIPSPSLWRNNIVLGSVIHSENVIRFVKTFPRAAYSNGNTVSEFIEIFGPLKKSGHLLTVNSSNNMALDRSAGVAFALGRNYEADAEEPNLVSDSASTPVFHRYSSTSGGFTKDDGIAGAGYTDIDPTKYDNNGTLTTVSGGHYTAQRLYYFPNNTGVIVAYYGKNEYASMDLAEKNYLLEDFQEAENTSSQAIYLGAIILKSNVTNLNTATDAKILTGGIFRSLSAANLGGVAVDSSLDDLIDVNITNVQQNQVIKYNSSTGNWENQADTGGIGLTDLSVGAEGTASGNGALDYDNTTGVFTYTPPVFIDGSGTAGKLPKFSDSDTLTDSVINEVFGNIGINTSFPNVSFEINASDAIKIPSGSQSSRPGIPANGMLRYSTTDNQFEGYANGAWGAIAGSGGGSSDIERNTFSGDGTTTQFTVSSIITDEVNTQVYIDGVYQSKLNYSIAGNIITFSTAPHSGTNNIEVINVKSVTVDSASGMNKNTFTGDGSTTSFTLSSSPTSEDFTFVFVQGVYQEKSTYIVANNTLTFSTAPQNGYTVEVMHMSAVNVQQSSYMEYDAFTGTGSQTAFTLVNGNPTDEKFTMVFLQGVYQEKSTYSLSNRVITFTTAPDNNYTIEIMSVNSGGLLTVPSHKPTVGVISSNTTAVANSVYVLTANLTLTLPANPQIGDSVKVSNRSGVATCIIGANNKKIMGANQNITLDTASASFEMIYSGADQGWVIIGQ